jgi:hypothetical protein
MTKEQRFKEIEKIWKKHATGRQNLIATILPHANQKAFFNELNQFMEDHPCLPEPNIKKV